MTLVGYNERQAQQTNQGRTLRVLDSQRATLFARALFAALAVMNENKTKLQLEAQRATEMLQGKVVSEVWRHAEAQMGIRFTDGTRLFVDQAPNGVELSITEGQ